MLSLLMSWGRDSSVAEAPSFHVFAGVVGHGFSLLEGCMDYEVHHAGAAVKFLVRTENELDKGLVGNISSPCIKGGKGSVIKLPETAWHGVPFRGTDCCFITFLVSSHLDAFS